VKLGVTDYIRAINIVKESGKVGACTTQRDRGEREREIEKSNVYIILGGKSEEKRRRYRLQDNYRMDIT
jgi:hypothetical protein